MIIQKKSLCVLFLLATLLHSVHPQKIEYEPLESGYMYAPWRENYATTANHQKEFVGCPFCNLLNNEIKDDIPLGTYQHCSVVLNRFPYSKGHLLIVSHEHVGDIRQLSKEARAEMFEMASASSNILQQVFQCSGINMGMSMSLTDQKMAIAGHVPGHIHLHIVPRYGNIDGFMEAVLNTRVIPWNMQWLHDILSPYFKALERN